MTLFKFLERLAECPRESHGWPNVIHVGPLETRMLSAKWDQDIMRAIADYTKVQGHTPLTAKLHEHELTCLPALLPGVVRYVGMDYVEESERNADRFAIHFFSQEQGGETLYFAIDQWAIIAQWGGTALV